MESMWYVVLQGCKLPIKLVQDYGINLPDGSGMNREVHVPFCEGLAGKFSSVYSPNILFITINDKCYNKMKDLTLIFLIFDPDFFASSKCCR